MATSSEIKLRAKALAEKTDVNSISPQEVGGIMQDLASHSENVLRNGGTLGIRKVYVSVEAMEADRTAPVDFWGNPIKKGNLVVIYDGTTTGLDNNQIYAFMNPGWELATKLDAGYAMRAEIEEKLSELGSEVNILPLYNLEKASLTNDNELTLYVSDFWNTYYKVEVKKGDVFKYSNLRDTSNKLNIGFCYYYITNLDGVLLKKLESDGIWNNINIEYIMPEDGFVSVCFNPDLHDVYIGTKSLGIQNMLKYYKEVEGRSYDFRNTIEPVIGALKNNMSLSTENTGWCTIYKSFVKKGGRVFYKKEDANFLSEGFSYIIIEGYEGNILYRLDSEDVTNGMINMEYTMPENGFVSLCYFLHSKSLDLKFGIETSNYSKDLEMSDLVKYLQPEDLIFNEDGCAESTSAWKSYNRVRVYKGDCIVYNRVSQATLSNKWLYVLIVDNDNNVLKLVKDQAIFNLNYTMPVDGYVSLCVYTEDPYKDKLPHIYSFSKNIHYLFEQGDKMNSNINNNRSDLGKVSEELRKVKLNEVCGALLKDTSVIYNTYWKTIRPKLKKGDKIIIEKSSGSILSDSCSYYIITNKDGEVLTRMDADGTSKNLPFNLEYVMPEDGFAFICYSEIDELNIETNNSVNDGILGSIELVNSGKIDVNALDVTSSAFLGIYKFGSIGASISVGHMTNPLTGVVNNRNMLFSWGQILARKNGQKCLNFGFSGASATTWFTNEIYKCAEEVSKPENLCQVYIIQLGFNYDAGGVGSYSDVDWDNRENNALTFYGQYARVIQLLREVAPDAVIFCLSLPYPRKNDERNNVIRNIAEDGHVNSHTFYVDMNKYDEVLEKYVVGKDNGEAPATFDKFYYDWHYTSVGYAEYSRIIERAVSDVINNNAESTVIRSIGFAPYGDNDMIE